LCCDNDYSAEWFQPYIGPDISLEQDTAIMFIAVSSSCLSLPGGQWQGRQEIGYKGV